MNYKHRIDALAVERNLRRFFISNFRSVGHKVTETERRKNGRRGYKDFKNSEMKPDRRLPHRNNILHRGTLQYSDEEIELAYYTLVAYILFIYEFSN